MIRLAANLKWLFTEWRFEERFAAAARAGFTGVEYSLPYEHDARELRTRCEDLGLEYLYLLSPCGDWEGGERGLACLPDRVAEFRDGVERALDYACTLGRPLLHISAGNRGGHPEALLAATYLANLAWSAEKAAARGIRIVIEPVCRASYADFYLRTVDEAARHIAATGSEHIGIVFDFHHVQRESGNLLTVFERHREAIAHLQIANPPGRHEPGAGEVDIPFCLARMEALGYRGWAACEYRPLQGTAASLAWARAWNVDARSLKEPEHAAV